ncbi:MAG: 50S ribosomal protein L21 [Chloroflexota bacterium]|nr:50S ribosomal protein L21 [Chloroflexota bacterium]
MYAIVKTGGKQYWVQKGQTLDVERLPAGVGEEVKLDQVLLISDDGEVTVGQPMVEGAEVRATVLRQDRDRKIIVLKFKSKNRYRRKIGHRQPFTRLRIEEIFA